MRTPTLHSTHKQNCTETALVLEVMKNAQQLDLCVIVCRFTRKCILLHTHVKVVGAK